MKRELTHEEEIKKMAEYGAALASDTKKSEKIPYSFRNICP